MALKRMTGDERREQIILVAAQKFSDEGFSRTTTKEIAAAAGINEAVIYRHFRSKEALYDAAIDFYIEQVRDILPKVTEINQADDFGQILYGIGCRVLHFLNDNVPMTRMLLYSGLEDHRMSDRFLAAVTSGAFLLIINRISQEQQSGTVRRDLDPRVSAFKFIASMIFFNIARNIMHAPFIQDVAVEAYVRNQVSIYMNGIRPKE